MILIGDFETNGLNPTKVHCAVFQEYGTKREHVFTQNQCYSPELRQLLLSADKIVGHNFIGYDLPLVIHKLLKVPLDSSKILDTLILSKMAQYHRLGGHGLDNLGKKVGVEKPKHNEWDVYSPEMLHRCRQDVEINYRVYDMLKFELEGTSDFSIELEHKTQWILNRSQQKGFYFDKESASDLYDTIEKQLRGLELGFRNDFPAKPKQGWDGDNGSYRIKTKTIKVAKTDPDGNKVKARNPETGKLNQVYYTYQDMSEVSRKVIIRFGISPDNVMGDFCPIVWEDFNPGSPEQIVERLNEAGWKPVNFRKATPQMEAKGIYRGSPIVSDEENLQTLPENAPDSIKKIAEYLILRSRANMIKQWIDVCTPEDSRIHGEIKSLGARTHRCSHVRPNTANIPTAEAPFYGKECRSFWTVPDLEKTTHLKHPYRSLEERVIVGVDASGIQGRILCHYMKDPVYTEVTIAQDIHSYNMFAAGIDPGGLKSVDEDVARAMLGYVPTPEEALMKEYGKDLGFEWRGRSKAKTFYYAFLLGAGDKKIQQITGRSGREVKENFFNRIPALRQLIDGQCREDYRKGWFEALDGRRIQLEHDKPHKVLSVYLQSGEAIVMKTAMCKIQKFFEWKGWDVIITNFVHDEFVFDAPKSLAQDVLDLAKQCIIETGEEYGLLCPLGASGAEGKSWSDVH